MRRVHDRLQILTPLPLFPKGLDWPTIGRLNYALSIPLLRRQLARFGISKPVIWLSLPPDRALIGRMDESLVIYDCMDRHAEFRKGRRAERVAKEEIHLLEQAGVVLASSADLLDHCFRHNANAYLVRNGVNPEWLRRRAQESGPGEQLPESDGPTLGYVGTIGPWLDIELLAQVASQLPSAKVVLVGPVETDLSPVSRFPNVIITGPVPYSAIPGIIDKLDVCLLPFKLNNLTRAVDPIKLYEYAALGKPMVSTPLPEVMDRGDISEVAGREDFVNAIRGLLSQQPQPAVRQRRIRFAEDNSWSVRASRILSIIERHLGKT
jgi:glycosyltransferase involved in cell wall biosynthesis